MSERSMSRKLGEKRTLDQVTADIDRYEEALAEAENRLEYHVNRVSDAAKDADTIRNKLSGWKIHREQLQNERDALDKHMDGLFTGLVTVGETTRKERDRTNRGVFKLRDLAYGRKDEHRPHVNITFSD